jgi:hypothetical protein
MILSAAYAEKSEPERNGPQRCDLDHLLHAEGCGKWDGADGQTTGFDHALHIRPALSRILPHPPRRNAETASNPAREP